MIPTLWIIITVTFVMVYTAPGGPFVNERAIPEEAKAALYAKYGLDQPLHVQYFSYLSHAVRLDFGPSYKHPDQDVREIILQSFPVSLELGFWALLVALLIGIPIGVWAAYHQNTPGDYASMSLALLGVSIPNFVLGPILILVFALTLYWLPPALWTGPESRVLPVLTLSAIYIAYIARLSRGGMLETLRQDYIRTARAKGLDEKRVVFRHAVRLGLLPVVSFLGPATARVVMGSLVVEKIFAIPGLGKHLVTAAFNRDYTLVLGVVVFYAVFLLIFNLLVDIAYAKLDPRVELH